MPRKKTAGKRKYGRKSTNIFAMFDKGAIQEMKEAFFLIDQDRDGFIGNDDLKDMFASLGKQPNDKLVESMIKESPAQMNFTAFLSLFANKLGGTDPEDDINKAFEFFDPNKTGKIKKAALVELLTKAPYGDKLNAEELSAMMEIANVDHKGMFHYRDFTAVLKGKEVED
ncbi:myosin regulatory light chain 12A-like [Branchiostoma lanceolatum]|uniref:MYL12A protein n=1 Tax=Branchiostoma lanceolatum TaxID=7740 RepID=A0A8K0ENK7_BRALA|nr:MYL12A [Branchiostoma lanceolatum]